MKKTNIKKINFPFAILLILLLSVISVGMQIFIQVTDASVFANYYKAPLIFVFNWLPLFLAILFLYFLTNSIAISYGIVSVFHFVLLTVNHYKVYFRDEPLIPTDLNLITETANIMQNYELVLSKRIVLAGVLLVLLIVFLSFLTRCKKQKWYLKLTGAVVVIALSIVSVKYVYHNEVLYDSFIISENQYNDVSVNNSRGFLYNFLYKTTSISYQKPEGYTPQLAEHYMEGYGKNYSKEQDTPNIIAIMSEAFFDPNVANNINFYPGKNPMDEYYKIRDNSLYGTLIVPGFAGATSSTEFEFLSGANLSLLDKSMPTVYKTHITKNMYCLPRMLNEMGYRSVAIHPGNKWFYNRQNVYKRMGFEKYITKDDLPSDVEKVNWYISDSVTSDLIIDEYKNHLETSPDKKYFNFTVTIQNHGPYREYEMFSDPYIMPIEGMSEELYTIINNYMYGLEDAVDLLKKVTEYANTLDTPTVVVFFGDHLPYFDGEFIGFNSIGMGFSDQSLTSTIKKHSVPYLLWSNDAQKEKLGNVRSGNNGPISSNFLSVLAMQYMDMDMPPFYDYVNSIFKELKVITPTYYFDGAYKTEYTDKQKEKLKGYKYLQYYNMRNY